MKGAQIEALYSKKVILYRKRTLKDSPITWLFPAQSTET